MGTRNASEDARQHDARKGTYNQTQNNRNERGNNNRRVLSPPEEADKMP